MAQVRSSPNEALVRALRSVLRADVGLSVDVRSLDPGTAEISDSEEFVSTAVRHRVAQVLAPHASSLGLSECASARLSEAARRSRLAAMATMAETIRVSAHMQHLGIRHLVVKGVALSAQTTGSPLQRVSTDVDVLVDPGDLVDVLDALERLGLKRNPGSPDPRSALFGLAQRTAKEVLMWHGDRQVDVHWRLDHARCALPWQMDELLESAEWMDLGGAAVPTLSRADAAIFNAAHASGDAWSRLTAVVDQVRLLRQLNLMDVSAKAKAAKASRRLEIADAMSALLLGERNPALTPTGRRLSGIYWSWILAGREPGASVGVIPAARSFAMHLFSYESTHAAAQRAQTLALPVEPMARRALGGLGDRHPWLYVVATLNRPGVSGDLVLWPVSLLLRAVGERSGPVRGWRVACRRSTR